LNVVVVRWWEWLGRVASTVLAMALAGLVVFVVVALALAPSTVSDWHDQVVVPIHVALGISALVAVLTGILFWRVYPSVLRSRGIGWGDR